MPRKRRDEEQNRVPELKGTTYYAPSDAYHQDALNALSSGAYGKQHMAQRRAAEYQKNLADEQKKYSYNKEAAKNNTLEKADKSFGLKSFGLESSDHDYLQRIYDRYGDSELTRRSLRESNQTKDWERKYGKSYDQIYEDFLADQGNVKMQMGEEHPFLTEIGTVLNSIPTAVTALPSLLSNAIAPDTKAAKNFENIRAKKSEENKYWRAGVKENTGEKGDKAIDMANALADRMAVTTAGKVAGTALGGTGFGEFLGSTMAGLSEANQRMDDLNLRPELSARQKALTALGHGAVEAGGTALVGGWLDKIPGAKNLGGALWNLGKGAFEGAAENAVSEIIHNTLDTAINKEQSQKELTKAIYMAQGMSEQDAEDMARSEQASGVGNAALLGAGFGAGMRGVSVGAKKLIPSLFDPEYGKVETYKIYEPDENAKAPASGEAPRTNIEQPKVEQPTAESKAEAPIEQPRVEAPAVEHEVLPEAPKEYAVQELNGKNGKKIYTVREIVDDSTTRPAEAGKVYKTKAEAEEAMKRLSENSNTTEPKAAASTPKATGLQGAELDNAKARHGELKTQIADIDNQIKAIQKQIDELPNLKKNYKQRSALFKQMKELAAQKKAISKEFRVLGNNISGKKNAVKDLLSDEDYKSLFEWNGNGVDTDINYAVKYAGDTPEAKALGNAVKKARDKVVETGDFEDLTDFIAKAIELDEMAKSVDAEYAKSAAKRYGDYFADGSLNDRLANNPALYNAMRLAQGMTEDAGESTPKVSAPEPDIVPEVKPVETPVVTEPVNEVPEVKPNQGTYEIPQNTRVPEMNAPEGGDQLSQHYYTLKNSDMFQTSETKMKMLEEAKEKGTFNKGVESRLKAREEALREYIKDPELAKQNNMNKQWDSGKDIDTSMLIMHDALENGDQAEFNLTALKQTEELKGAAREMRASRDYSGTKEGTLVKGVEYLNDKADAVLKSKKVKSQFENIANRIFNDGDYSGLAELGMDDVNIQNIRNAIEAGASKENIVKMLAMHKAVGATQISADTIMKINDIYNEIEARGLNPTSRARAELEADAYKILAQDIGGRRTVKDMWNAWRYLAMLGNPKTHLRNIMGNTTHYMVSEIKDSIGAIMEEAVDKANRASGGEGIERTKARLTGEDNGLVEMSARDADDVAYSMLNDTGNKYNDVKGEIDRARNSFNSKALSKVDELNSNLLDLEDYSALKRKYSKSLARFLKANGADEDIFYATDEASQALLDKARAYAIDQAKQATFHEYSKMAEALTQFSQKLSEGNAAAKIGGAMVEGLVPFKKTPINILKQAIKYSPVSFAKGIGKMMDAVRTGNSSASDAIEDFASGLTGTGIMALGYFLAHEGFLTGGQNADWDVDNAESEQGKQNYALKIGNKSYTLDWLAPMSLPLFVGAELNNLFDSDGEEDADTVDKVISALSTIAEPVTEMSMLQGIQNALNELSYSRENILGTFASNATLGYASQGVPTLAGQVARAIDPYRRSTYSDQPSGFKRQFDKTLQKIENKIPFLSMAQEPYIDYKGNQQETQGVASSLLGNNFGTRLIDQMVSPGYYKEGNITPLDSELNRLYEKTGIDVYPNVASGTVDNQRLDKESFTKYQTLYGQNTDQFLNAFIQSDGYNTVDDQTKAETINNIKGFARKIADYEVGGKALGSKTDQDLYNIYKKEGAQGVANYYNDKAKAESLGLTYDTYMKKEAENPGSAEQYARDKETAVSLGFVKSDGSPNTDGYEKAVAIVGNEVPALQSYMDYQSQEMTKNDEKVPYLLDNNSFTDEQKGKLISDTVDPSKLKGKVVTDMYNMGGYEGVYYWYVLKYLADQYGDQNGYVKKDEKNALLNSNDPYVQKLSDEMYYYLANAKW